MLAKKITTCFTTASLIIGWGLCYADVTATIPVAVSGWIEHGTVNPTTKNEHATLGLPAELGDRFYKKPGQIILNNVKFGQGINLLPKRGKTTFTYSGDFRRSNHNLKGASCTYTVRWYIPEKVVIGVATGIVTTGNTLKINSVDAKESSGNDSFTNCGASTDGKKVYISMSTYS